MSSYGGAIAGAALDSRKKHWSACKNSAEWLVARNSDTFYKKPSEIKAITATQAQIKAVQDDVTKKEAALFGIGEEEFHNIDTDNSGTLNDPEIHNHYVREIVKKQQELLSKGPISQDNKQKLLNQPIDKTVRFAHHSNLYDFRREPNIFNWSEAHYLVDVTGTNMNGNFSLLKTYSVKVDQSDNGIYVKGRAGDIKELKTKLLGIIIDDDVNDHVKIKAIQLYGILQ